MTYVRLKPSLFVAGAMMAILAGCSTNSQKPEAAAVALGEDVSGRWAVRLEGRPVVTLELERSPTAPGGWTGRSTVASFDMTPEHAFSKVTGPSRVRPIVWSNAASPDIIEFRVAPDRETYTFRVLADGTARFGWKGVSVEPLVMSRLAEGEEIPSVWDPTKAYVAEDGHI